MKTNLLIILSFLLFWGCTKDDNTSTEPTVDYETFGYVMSWTEIESKTGDSEWKDIADGQILTFFSNSIDEKLRLPNNGKVIYSPELNISIKNNTSFNRNDSSLIFYNFPYTQDADTVNLSYKIIDSSTLIISNISVVPNIEIKYKRNN